MCGQALPWFVAFSLTVPLHGVKEGGAKKGDSLRVKKQWQDDARASTHIEQGQLGSSFCSEEGWQYDLKEDFEGEELDPTIWSVIKSVGATAAGASAGVSGLGDTACRTAACREENVRLVDGKLVMHSERDSGDSTRFYTGAVTTKGKRGWRHNTSDYRVCVRAKLPSGGKGVWPAHWMLPDNGISDQCLDEGEVDIMEMINSDGNVYNTYHWMSSYPKLHCAAFDKYHKSEAHQAIMPRDWDSAFHEYAVERRGDGMSYAIDGRKVFDVEAAKDHFTLTQSPFFLILNTAIGGGWPGEPTHETKMPTDHSIDYVHVVVKKP